MRLIQLLLLFVLCFIGINAQQTPVKADLKGLTQSIVINGHPALRIASRDGNWIEVQLEKQDEEDTLIFPVTRIKSFGAGAQRAEEGKLFVSKNRIVYTADFEKEKSFELSRSEILEMELKEMGQGFDCIVLKTQEDKKRFILAGTVFLNGNFYKKKDVLRPALTYMFQALQSFDSAVNDFRSLTAGATK
jgi:hypothetical protein